MIWKILIFTILLIFCSWFLFWPLYEWMVGIRPWFDFLNQTQMLLFGLGFIVFMGALWTGKKITLG